LRLRRDPGDDRAAAGRGDARERAALVVAGKQPHRIQIGEGDFGASLSRPRLRLPRRTTTAAAATSAAAHPSAAASAASRTARPRRRDAHGRIDPRRPLPIDRCPQPDEPGDVAIRDPRPRDATIGRAEERSGGERAEQEALAARIRERRAHAAHVDAHAARLLPYRLRERGLQARQRRRLEHGRGSERVDDPAPRDEPRIERQSGPLPFDSAVVADQHP